MFGWRKFPFRELGTSRSLDFTSIALLRTFLDAKQHLALHDEVRDLHEQRVWGSSKPAPTTTRDQPAALAVEGSSTNASHPSSAKARLGSKRASASPFAGCNKTVSPTSRCCHSG